MGDDTLPAAVRTARAESVAEYAPRGARALAAWPVTTSEIDVAGVSCQVVEPEGDPPKGTMLYFFGGGYVLGRPEFDLPITAPLAVLGSLRIIAPRYPLAPEHPFPVSVTQAFDVYRTLTADGPLSICGESAGGGLAIAVTQRAFHEKIAIPTRMALFSPWGDITEQCTAQSEVIDDPWLSEDDLRFFAATYLAGADARDPSASPALAPIPSDWPDTLLTTGGRDKLRLSVHALADKLRLAGAACQVTDLGGMWHAFEVYDENPEALESLKLAAAFLKGDVA